MDRRDTPRLEGGGEAGRRWRRRSAAVQRRSPIGFFFWSKLGVFNRGMSLMVYFIKLKISYLVFIGDFTVKSRARK